MAAPSAPDRRPSRRPVALTVAGSDSGGGAGIEADLKVFALHGVFGCVALTGLTAQNSRGVQAVEPVRPGFVRAQLASVLGDFEVAAVKTGMLWSGATVRVAAEALAARRLPLVLDPVMFAKGGERLLRAEAVAALGRHLLPLAALVTPNLPEAAALLGREVSGLAAMRDAARALVERGGAGAALVKGGHGRGRTVVDVLFDGRDLLEIVHTRRRTRHTHGTGCVLSAAVTARLARGEGLRAAVAAAVEWLAAILARARPLGAGHGPADPLLAAPPGR